MGRLKSRPCLEGRAPGSQALAHSWNRAPDEKFGRRGAPPSRKLARRRTCKLMLAFCGATKYVENYTSISYAMRMRYFSCILLFAALALTACPPMNSKKPAKTGKPPSLGEASADVDFQAFVSRLRKVVKAHDVNVLASMMTPDFAYVLGATPAEDRQGPGVFQYWDEKGLWPELEGIVSERFVQKETYMVAPPQFADPSAEYEGYRAGIRRVNGSWKFAYFVRG